MTHGNEHRSRRPVILGVGEGRCYDMGPIQAIFKSDGSETSGAYSISEWRLEPHTTGPGAHQHPEDDVFYVTEGTMSVLVDDQWIDAPAGSFVLIPGGVTHDFENRSSEPAAALNVSQPGDFEQHMPDIVDWFRDHPPGHAG
jgi:quercetin dioxygenase-like cupin family protein